MANLEAVAEAVRDLEAVFVANLEAVAEAVSEADQRKKDSEGFARS